jgi:CheY-like chemotaxis protein/anti-sigma regulatory factor (Ser/Thr protein kinase)
LLDEIRIKQVIFNLVGNAIKFTHTGYVRVIISFSYQKKLSGFLTIEVEDTGIGIPESEQEIIFEAFGQQSAQSGSTYGGVGLGLAISRRLVEHMNGTITVSSKVGKGSVFKVTIPHVEVSSAEFIKRADTDNPGVITFEKGHILIVDDISSNIEMVETLLAPTELKVSSAESGEIALEVLNHLIPDLILIDIRMPGMNGFEVAARIKSNPLLAHIPVIAFTAAVFDSARIEKSGIFDAILLKPVNRMELFDRLARFLRHEIELSESISVESELTLPERIKDQLPAIKEIIDKEIMPEYFKIKDHLVLFRIEEFATALKKVAEKYNFELLDDYADKFLLNLEIVDLDLIEETLAGFPGFINKIFAAHNELR